LSTRALVAKI